jgi:acetyl esterase/lipase
MRSIIIIAVIVALVGVGTLIALFPLRALSAITSRKGSTVEADIAYGQLACQRLDIYTPDNAKQDAPVVVFFHGGGWRVGEKKEFGFIGQALASAGVTVVIPDYRLNPEVVFPEFVRDGAAAVAWAAKNYPGRRLFAAGHSAGAHIAALIALDERYLAEAGAPGVLAGMIGLSGPYDFLPLTEERYKRVFPEATRDESQPINFVDGNEPPMLLATGTEDRTVKPGNTTRLAARIREKGGRVSVKEYPGVSHLGTMLALAEILPHAKPPVRDDILAFFEETSR